MADNLTISIAANTDKANANLALLQAQLRATNKEVRALANAGAKVGDAVPSAGLQAATARAGALNTQIRELNGSLGQTSTAMDLLSQRSTRRLLTQFNSLGKTARNLASVFGGIAGGFAGGFVAGAAVSAVQQLSQALSDVAEKLTKLRTLARETGLPPAAIEAARKLATARGESADDATKMMTKTAEAFQKMKTEAGKPIQMSGVKDLTQRTEEAGNAATTATSEFQKGTAVLRGNSRITFDASKAYELLGVRQKDYKDNAQGVLQFQTATNKAFLEFAQKGRLSASQLNAISQELYGLPKDTALALIPGQLADMAKKMKELGDIQARIDAVTAMNVQKDRVAEMFNFMLDKGSDWRVAMSTASNKWLADTVTSVKAVWSQIGADFQSSWATMWQNMANSMPDWIGPTKQAFSDFLQWMESATTGTADAIGRAWASMRATLSTSFPGDPGGFPAMPAGNAAGGMIRGPGSGTSDSILARLSNGEFVMKARAVEHWGPRFMAALNAMQNPFGYRAGGLVRPRFAAGGMVAARTADGVTVNLTFAGGGSFALRGDREIVGGLTREARRAGMLSGGRLAAAIN